MKNFSFLPSLLAFALMMGLALPTVASSAGEGPDQERLFGNQLRSLVVGQTWYGIAMAGFSWVEYYSPSGDAFYEDEQGRLTGTWEIRGDEEICFHYPALDTFCFIALLTPSGQVAIYDLDRDALIHMTTRIVPGDPERLADQPQEGDIVGD